MKYNRIIKNFGDPEYGASCDWKCTKCGFKFTLYGPNGKYAPVSFCPNCGVPHTKVTTNKAFMLPEDDWDDD